MPCKKVLIASWICQVIAAVILAQTLFFKFTGAPESIYIFKTLGMEPAGRYGSGSAELVAVVLLLIPRTAVLGAILSLGVISGAIVSHLTQLGITIPEFDDKGVQTTGNDSGLLFGLAVLVFVTAAFVVYARRGQIPFIGPKLAQLIPYPPCKI